MAVKHVQDKAAYDIRLFELSSCSKMVFCRLSDLMDLAVDEFPNAPPGIFIGCLTTVDY